MYQLCRKNQGLSAYKRDNSQHQKHIETTLPKQDKTRKKNLIGERLARVQLLIIKTTLSKQEKQKNKTKTDCVDIMFRYRLFVMASKHYQLL